MDELPPRRRLHHGIRREFARAIARYYRLHPEKLDDPDREEGTNALLKMLEDVLKVVDLFNRWMFEQGYGQAAPAETSTLRS